MSFGPNRTKNCDIDKYINHIRESRHGSILEHASYTFLFYGVSRSLTHELVRHRVGTAFCLDGDTEIYFEHLCNGHRQGARRRKIKDLYEQAQTKNGRGRISLMNVRCLDESSGEFTTGSISAVTYSGKKAVYKITLEDGKSIVCSKDHRFLSPNGWDTIDSIVGGIDVTPGGVTTWINKDAYIMTNGIKAYKDKDWLYNKYIEEGLSQEEIGNICGISKHTVRGWVRRYKLQKPYGSWTIGRSPWNKGKTYKRKPLTEEQKRRISKRMLGAGNPQWKGGITSIGIALRRPVEKFRMDVYRRDNFSCVLCSSKKDLTIHHVIPLYVDVSGAGASGNTVTLCRPCHNKVNGHEEDYVRLFNKYLGNTIKHTPKFIKKLTPGTCLVPKKTRIVSVEYVGIRDTYDIEMKGDNHNFVANGIVTHNSQISQRFIDESKIRFVERPEFQNDPDLHAYFEDSIDLIMDKYREVLQKLSEEQKEGSKILYSEYKTELRKKVHQASRYILPNCTEAPIVVTANARAWRHFLEMRGSSAAETEIRSLAIKILCKLRDIQSLLFSDYEIVPLPDGTSAITTPYVKV
jgi:thymidylate synthase (FAD)